ncbi:unnamed protein product, partial [Laminaria digitata]
IEVCLFFFGGKSWRGAVFFFFFFFAATCRVFLPASMQYKMLYFNENVTTVPTVGINGERVEYKNMGMTIW